MLFAFFTPLFNTKLSPLLVGVFVLQKYSYRNYILHLFLLQFLTRKFKEDRFKIRLRRMYRLHLAGTDQFAYFLSALFAVRKLDILARIQMHAYHFPVVVFPAEFIGCSDVNDPSLIEQRDGIAELVRFFHVVGGKEDRTSFLFLITDYPVDRL